MTVSSMLVILFYFFSQVEVFVVLGNSVVFFDDLSFCNYNGSYRDGNRFEIGHFGELFLKFH